MSHVNFVIFGVTSNLAKIKLIPALYDLYLNNEICDQCKIFGVYRQERSADEIKLMIRESVAAKYALDETTFANFYNLFDFERCDFSSVDDYKKLNNKIRGESNNLRNRIFYLATTPKLYADVFASLEESGLNNETDGYVRIMIEKPIGYDLESSEKINQELIRYYKEDQIYRIDHYLAKETIQNILAFRFNNPIFKNTISAETVDHIQITNAEILGVDSRSGYFDEMGSLRDVGQSHLLQMLAVATMDNVDVGSRLEVIDNLILHPESLVLGTYNGFDKIDTYFAFKATIDKGVLKGVPVYIRAGKKLKRTVTEIMIVFKGEEKNSLIYRIQPNEGIIVNIKVKKPGEKMELQDALMQFCFKQFDSRIMGPYEKLILDAIKGDKTFFNNADEIRAQWKFIDGLKADRSNIFSYDESSWGPVEAEEMIKRDGREWDEPNETYCQI